MAENKDFENEYDSFKDVAEFQNNMFNPGYYVGTGKVPPTVTAPGNAMPLAIAYFISAAIALGFGLFFLLSDITFISIETFETSNKDQIILSAIFFGSSALSCVFAFSYLRKAKRYKSQKQVLEKETVNDEIKDELWQRTCPKCGDSHDIDYPKCPKCGFNYLE